jgi:hypothetical protein
MMSFAVDWSGIEWLADGAGDGAFANKYKVAAAFGQNVINIQKPGFAAEAGIYTNFPAGISSCSLPDGKYVIEGAGMILYLTAFTAKETAVSVEAGGSTYDFTVFYADGTGEVSGGGSEPDPDPDPHQGDLTPATYHGSEVVTCAGADVTFNWAITRNADATLTFELKWSSDIVGSVPQVCINGAFTTMPAQERVARFTTTATFVDGETLNDTFFYMAYAGGAARIEITGYTVGASNEEPQPMAIENIFNNETRTRKVIENGMLYIIKDGIRYNALGVEIK